MTLRLHRFGLPSQLVSLGLGAMILTCLVLVGASVAILLANAHDQAVEQMRRGAAVAVQLAGELPARISPESVLPDLRTVVGDDVALYQGDVVVASSGLGGAMAGTTLPAAIHDAVLLDGRVVDDAGALNGTHYFLRYAPVGPPGHAFGVLLIGLPARPFFRPVLLTGETILLASLVILSAFGWVFVQLGGRMAAGIEANQAELKRTNTSFRQTIASMSQGYALYDAEGRIIACNELFGSVLGIASGRLAAGSSLRETVLLARRAKDHPLDSVDAFVAARLRSMSQGQTIRESWYGRQDRPVLIKHQPLAEGGWITTVEDLADKQEAQAEIRFLKHFDRVTHLPNRDHLISVLQSALDRAESAKTGQAVWPAVLKIDLVRMKSLHDSYGVELADKLINEVKERLQRCLDDADVLARVRVDELLVLPAETVSRTAAAALAERLLAEINRLYEIDGRTLSVGAVIGIAMAPEHGKDAETLLKTASIAMQPGAMGVSQQGAAQMGGARGAGSAGAWHMFEPGMEGVLSKRLSMEADLNHALEGSEFQLFYQPLIDMKRDRICCFEALLRWNHPKRGMVSPVDFIPMTETTGLIVPIGAWVVGRACSDAAGWPEHVRVAVNISAIQLRDAMLVQVVRRALAESGLAPGRLELEVTETVLLEGDYAAMDVLHELRGLGVRISMDDFGTGHSSLSYLRDFPFDKIKIDKSFVQQMLTRPDCLAIVRTVTGLAGSLGMSVTAEGAETLEQVNRLRLEGCSEVQGFYFSKPRPLAEVPLLLERNFSPIAYQPA